MNITVREILSEDAAWIRALLEEYWGSVIVVSRGRLHRADQLPGFVAVASDERVGLITFNIEQGRCEIVTVNAAVERKGIGTRLVQAVHQAAVAARCSALWLITTNDNLSALRFWQRRGFLLGNIYRNAVDESRKLKPQIPLIGCDGIAIRDEIELEMLL